MVHPTKIIFLLINQKYYLKKLVFAKMEQKLFESTNIENGWNGIYKGNKSNVGVYVYRIEAELTNGSNISRKGNITLVR